MKNTLYPVKLVGLINQLRKVWGTDESLPSLERFVLKGYPNDNHLRYPLLTTGVHEYAPLVDACWIRLVVPSVEDIDAVRVELYGFEETILASYPASQLTGAFALAVEVEILTIILGGYGFRVTTQ